MHIVVVGGTGTIGRAVVKELSRRHTVIATGYNDGDLSVDITDSASIQKMYAAVSTIDAVVITAGTVVFKTLSKMTEQEYLIGLQNKLMGQVNVVLLGMQHMCDGGSFTLTSGILNHDPIVCGSSAAMVNGALEGFVKSAAIEMPRGLRINVISPTIVTESLAAYAEYFRGFAPVSSDDVALAYSKSIEGAQTGQIYKVGYV